MQALKNSVKTLKNSFSSKNQEVMVFADLIGGTPFNEFAKRSEVFQNGFQLLGGMNLGI